MKKKLMILFMTLLFMQTSIQATWIDDLKLYYAIACFIVTEKIKSMNPFGKATSSLDFDYENDDFSFEPEPVSKPTFKIYRKKMSGSLQLPVITAAMRKRLKKVKN